MPNLLAGDLDDGLVLTPAAWRDAFWWTPGQAASIDALIASLQQRHDIDSRRVFLIGVSDGGAGALYQAMVQTHPIAGVISLIGHPGVLYQQRSARAAAPDFAQMAAVPLLMINGASDRLMPTASLEPWLEELRSMNAPFHSYIQPGMGHELALDDEARSLIRGFLSNPRGQTAIMPGAQNNN